MIEIKRRTVYVVRGKTYLTPKSAYLREALLAILEECAKECESNHDEEGRELRVPSARACQYCGERPTDQQLNARAGELFERDFGKRREP